MKVTSTSTNTISGNSRENHSQTPTVQPRARSQSLGPLSGLSARRQNRSTGGETNATMGMNRTTAFHAGTHNDCGLHTIASMTGMSEEAVVKALGLSQRDIEHISAHGIEPDQFTAMMSYLNNGDVMHRHGTAAELVNDFLPNVPDGHQFAVGMQRPDGIGHLVAAERVGDHLQIHDRQIGTRTDLHSQEELNDYMWRQGATRVHTWYNKNYSGTPSNAGHPQAGHPQAGHPQAYPQGGHPQAYPQGGYPQAYPQGGYPYGGWK